MADDHRLDKVDVALLLQGLQELRVRVAATATAGAGIPGLVRAPETIERVKELEHALRTPSMRLLTPVADPPPGRAIYHPDAASADSVTDRA
jgi:hypothetical protein